MASGFQELPVSFRYSAASDVVRYSVARCGFAALQVLPTLLGGITPSLALRSLHLSQ
jgi:hypothetical protein